MFINVIRVNGVAQIHVSKGINRTSILKVCKTCETNKTHNIHCATNSTEHRIFPFYYHGCKGKHDTCIWIWHWQVQNNTNTSLIARFMGPTWGPSGAARTQFGPMLAPWTFLSGMLINASRYYSYTLKNNESCFMCREWLLRICGFSDEDLIFFLWHKFHG